MSISATPETAAAELTQSAQVLRTGTFDGGDVERLPDQLGDLVAALRVAAEACDSATSRVVPGGAGDHRESSRYREAAARWPLSPPPSHERFALALGDLHRAADAVRLAARRLELAQDVVDEMLARGLRTNGGGA
jgi:hypothetical protein